MNTIDLYNGTEKISLSFEPGETILQVLQKHNIQGVHAPCGGKGSCRKCAVSIFDGTCICTTLSCLTQAEEGLVVHLNPVKRVSFSKGSSNPLHPADQDGQGYGIACDLGTTTVCCHLMDLKEGISLGVAVESNAQSAYGENVLSRLQAASEGNADIIHQLTMEQLNRMIGSLCDRAGIQQEELRSMTLCAHTIMMHFAAGMNPAERGLAPFIPETLFGKTLKGSEIGLAVDIPVFFMPAVSDFCGSDVLADVHAAGLMKAEKPVLMMDIGTNSEMMLGCGDRFVSCAADAGSLFKGSFFDCGMTASSGAVSGVVYEDGKLILHVLGKSSPKGLCGSGIIDTIAIMTRLGALDEMGHIAEPDEAEEEVAPFIDIVDGKPAFYVSREAGLYITQKDIAKFQQAKGAVYAGIHIMASEYGIEVQDIDRCILAGGFGTFINPESASILGLIPQELISVTESLGNLSVNGAQSAAISSAARKELLELRENVRYIPLSSHPDFTDQYIDGMMFDTEE